MKNLRTISQFDLLDCYKNDRPIYLGVKKHLIFELNRDPNTRLSVWYLKTKREDNVECSIMLKIFSNENEFKVVRL